MTQTPNPAQAKPSSVALTDAAQNQTARAAAQRSALGWLHTARFWTTAAQLHQLPEHPQPEIAFVGRSNAGKSTCINTLTQTKRMAFASKTPGRTQHINLFSLGRAQQTDAVLADLPGYGYAAVPKEAKYRWQQVMANYLVSRDNLVGVVLLVDSRLGLTELDEALLGLLRERVQDGLQFLVLLTKADKLNRTESSKALSIAKLQCAGGEAMLFSALKKTGVAEVAAHVRAWVDADAAAQSETALDADGASDPDEPPADD